jgi:hypothetical protein
MSARVNPMAGLEEDTDELQPDAPVVRVANAKVSVSLPPVAYHGLVDYCAEATKGRGARVNHVDVFRALLAELLEDEALRARVGKRLRS